MAAPIVYSDVSPDANLAGQLFAGKKFWVAQRVPLRKTFLELIKNNGGEIVMLEKKADYMIADHCRRDCPPGSISYTFLEESVKQGEIQDPEAHRAGPAVGTAREAGSLARPTKGGRTAYTAEEDRVLYKWVRDCEAAGGLASGNEIYKQLEAKYPRHTWQSWRDRYLKQLRDRPPSAFSLPDNAPPSPPTDEPEEPAPSPAPKQEKKPAPKKKSGTGKARSTEFTVEELISLFNSTEWEDVYAFVEEIGSISGEEYLTAWRAWAEGRNHTAEQWQQYFEKVVRPQWQRDPASKHEEIRERVEKRNEEAASQRESQNEGSQQEHEEEIAEPAPAEPSARKAKGIEPVRKQGDVEDSRFEKYLTKRYKDTSPTAYAFYARKHKWAVWNDQPGLDYTGLHVELMSRWDALSKEEKQPYLNLEAAAKSRNEEEVTVSSPQALKRIREGDDGDEEQEKKVETPRPAKRAKPSPVHEDDLDAVSGTQDQPVEISSGESSQTSESQLAPDEQMEDVIQEELQAEEAEEFTESSESEAFEVEPMPPPRTNVDPLSSSDYPSNTPTPRAPRHKAPAFDTQAILSSPSQGYSLGTLPPPGGFTQHAESEDEEEEEPEDHVPSIEPSSPARRPPSDTSTTPSLEEFRRSLTTPPKSTSASLYPTLPPLPPPVHSPPPPSPSSTTSVSTNSGDPDPPLTPSEFDLFFDEQHDAGFTDEYITAALRHTRCRPDLAIEVMSAWKEGKPLPNQRGVWSKEDDEDVLSGDGRALARLEKKHSTDGWGGITERMRFLEGLAARAGN